MQVRDLDAVVVDDGDATHARGDERRHDRAAEPARAEHDDVRVGEAALRVGAPAGQHALAGVAGRVGVDRGHASILAGSATSRGAPKRRRGPGRGG